jgi:hypothetical protein
MELPVNEPLETRVQEPAGSLEALHEASADDEVAEVAARYPTCLATWAELGERAEAAGRTVEAYAYFRVGYHRGLDRIRQSGWRGSGRVPWSHEANRGFLRSLRGLGTTAGAIGEVDEAARCEQFLQQLAPDIPVRDE